MTESEFNLETHGDDGVPFDEMLNRIHSRPDSHCKWAYDFFDERVDEGTTTIVNNFAMLGWNTKQIYAHWRKFMPPECDAWPPRMHEMVALQIEWAVRRAS